MTGAVVAQVGPPVEPAAVMAAFGAVAVLLGLGALFLGVRTLRASADLDEFERVDARVLESELEENTRGKGTTYSPSIVYEYTVAGETYTNDDVSPGLVQGSNLRSKHEAVVEDHPEGEVVEAYYDPGDPSVAYLEDGSGNLEAYALVGAGGMALLLGVAFVVPFALSSL
ncbi:hypothetical protein BRD00_00385 [Halobacteriales archaeon QS_8_69_26]|nr:MAG: hypothetical protein BRD00_00385 [Halobacteriales archaeon QS_8_69_26]